MTEQNIAAAKEKKRGQPKQRTGVVIKSSTPQTVVVMVTRRVKHSRYPKMISARQKYAVHDLVGCQVGDQVRIVETRPMSKTKRWRVAEKIGTTHVKATAEEGE